MIFNKINKRKNNKIIEFFLCFSLMFNFKKIFVYKKTPDPTLEIFNDVRFIFYFIFFIFKNPFNWMNCY